MNKGLCTLAAVMLLALIVWAANDGSPAGCSLPESACLDIGGALRGIETSVEAHAVDRGHAHVAAVADANQAVQVSTPRQDEIAPRAPMKAAPVVPPASDGSRALPISSPGDSGSVPGSTVATASDVVDLADSGFEVTAMSGAVSVDWTTAHEVGVVSYLVDRRPQEAASYDLGVQVGYPQGEGALYSVMDRPPGTGTFIYRLRATFDNGTEAILAEGAVTP